MAVRYLVQHRRGTVEQWANSDIIPLAGELVVEIDEENNLHKLKIGDGIHKYSDLAYLQAGDDIVTRVLPRVIVVPLLVDSWKQITDVDDPKYGCYKQIVVIENITPYSRLDLHPEADMLAEFQNLDLVFVTENNNGVITVYSIGDMPLKDYSVQATIVETEVLVECDKIVGITVGTPTAKDIIRYIPQTLTEEQKTQARLNIGAGTSNFSGSYNELSDLPQIPRTIIPNSINSQFAVSLSGTDLTANMTSASLETALSTRQRAIAYSDGIWVAGDVNGALQYSTDNGVNWKEGPTLINKYGETETTTITSLTYGKGYFVAISHGNPNVEPVVDGTVYKSTDGLTWDVVQTNVTGFGDVIYANGRFVFVAKRGDIIFSDDLQNFETVNVGADASFASIAYGRDRFFVGTGDSEGDGINDKIYYSLDGLNWNTVESPVLAAGNGSDYWGGICYAKGKYLLGGRSRTLDGTTYSIVYSDDCITWYPANCPSNLFVRAIKYVNGKFFAVGYIGQNVGQVWTSLDGVNWDLANETSKMLWVLEYNDDKLITLGDGGQGFVFNFNIDWLDYEPELEDNQVLWQKTQMRLTDGSLVESDVEVHTNLTAINRTLDSKIDNPITEVETFEDIPDNELGLYRYVANDKASNLVEVISTYHEGGENKTFTKTTTTNNGSLSETTIFKHFDETLSNFVTVSEAIQVYTMYYAYNNEPIINGIKLGSSTKQGSLTFTLAKDGQIMVSKYYTINGSTGEVASSDADSQIIVDGETYMLTDTDPVVIPLTAGTHTITSGAGSNSRAVLIGFSFSWDAFYTYEKKYLARQEDLEALSDIVDKNKSDIDNKHATLQSSSNKNSQDIATLVATIGDVQIFDVYRLYTPSMNELKKLYRTDGELYQCIQKGEGAHKEFAFDFSGTSEIKAEHLEQLYPTIAKDFTDYFEFDLDSSSKVFRNNGSIKLGSSSATGELFIRVNSGLPISSLKIGLRAYNNSGSTFNIEIEDGDDKYYNKSYLIQDTVNETLIDLTKEFEMSGVLNYIDIVTQESHTDEDDETVATDKRGVITRIIVDVGDITYEWVPIGGTVDSALSSTSTNPVQNKVITDALNTRTIKQKSVTYNELKALHDANQLIAGMQYRIIDYVTTTTQQDTQSAGHQFDIIVTALSKDTLSENASAIKHGMSPEDVHILFEFGAGGYDADDTVADFGYEANNQGQTVPVIYFGMETDDGDVVTDFEDKWFYIDEYEFDGNVYSRWRLIEINSTDGCWTWDSPYRKYILTQPIVDDGQITVDAPAAINIAYKMYDDVDHIYEGPHSPGDVIVELSYGENEDGEVVPMLFKTDVTNSDVVDNEPDYGDPIFYVGRYEYHGEVYDRWRKVESYNWEEGYRRYMLTNIVVGDDGKFLSGSAYDYFTDANLPAWEIKYSLDNDDTRFAWADTENGKGVIYYMKDEWDNECHYDFKNIMFKRNAEWFTEHDDWCQSIFGESIDYDKWFYTFTWIDENGETQDLSLIGNTLLNDEQQLDGIYSNKIGVASAYSMGINKKTVEALSGNIFVNSSTYDTLFYGCKGNVLGADCVENTFGPDCKYSLLDSYCKYNTVGARSKSNIFETGCIRVNVTGECIYNVRACQGVGYTTLSPEPEAPHQQIYRKSGTQEILVD